MRKKSTNGFDDVGKRPTYTKPQYIAQSVQYNEANEKLARGLGIYIRGNIKLSEKVRHK